MQKNEFETLKLKENDKKLRRDITRPGSRKTVTWCCDFCGASYKGQHQKWSSLKSARLSRSETKKYATNCNKVEDTDVNEIPALHGVTKTFLQNRHKVDTIQHDSIVWIYNVFT